jgi:hypothetical protein
VTVIAAIPTPGGVFMAADSQLTRDHSIMGSVEKIIMKTAGGSEVLIAVTGNQRLASMARHSLQLSDAPDPMDAAGCDGWAYAVACALAELAVEAKPPVLDEDKAVDGEALLAFDRHLWLLNGQSAIRMGSACAIGCGAPEARGALHVAMHHVLPKPEPGWALAVAVQAAIDLDPSCGGEITLARTHSTTVQDQQGWVPPTRAG